MIDLTIGMASYKDATRTMWTIQALRLYHDCATEETEFVVVDASPESDHAGLLKNYLQGISGLQPIKYIEHPQNLGTTFPRDYIFKVASGDAVLVLDPHVMLWPGSIQRLKEYYRDNPTTLDLLSGPLMYDSLTAGETHYDRTWSAAMLGQWSCAWRCPCKATRFSVQRGWPHGIQYQTVEAVPVPVSACPQCGPLPAIDFFGHQEHLQRTGYVPLVLDDEPFDVPGQGLGCFTCRREAWLGWPQDCRNFGGEEISAHDQFRQAGRRVLCLPWLKWWHDFHRIGGAPYNPKLIDKVANYLIWRRALKQPVDDIHEHFVELDTHGEPLAQHLERVHGIAGSIVAGKSEDELQRIHRGNKISQKEWERMIQNPNVYRETVASPPDTSRPQPPEGSTLDQIYEWTKGQVRDLNEHADKLKELASQCDTILEITKRRESTVFLQAARPKCHVVYSKENDILLTTLHTAVQDEKRPDVHFSTTIPSDVLLGEPIECDMLFIDSIHHADRVYAELQRFGTKCKRWIVLRGTGSFGENADGGGPGLLPGWRRWQAEHPEWKRVYQADNQYGISVMSCDPKERSIDTGVGTHLIAIFQELGVNPPSCSLCKQTAREMDVIGVDSVKSRRDEFAARIRSNAANWSIPTLLANVAKASVKSLFNGMAFQINPLDPIPGLIDLAIERSERDLQAA